MSTVNSAQAPSAPTRAPARGAWRPIAPDRSISVRPSSSSARVARITPSAPIVAAAPPTKVPTRHIVKPPALMRSKGGPSIARMVGLAESAPIVAAPVCGSGKSVA